MEEKTEPNFGIGMACGLFGAIIGESISSKLDIDPFIARYLIDVGTSVHLLLGVYAGREYNILGKVKKYLSRTRSNISDKT